MKNTLIQLLEKYPDKPLEVLPHKVDVKHFKTQGAQWNWNYISCNPNITMDIIEKYPNKPWNWNNISFNHNITIDNIEKYPEKPWNWNNISFNHNITIDNIEKYPDKRWDW
jgi:hypothetical protein